MFQVFVELLFLSTLCQNLEKIFLEVVVETMPLAEEEVELKEAKEVKTTVSSFR